MCLHSDFDETSTMVQRVAGLLNKLRLAVELVAIS